MSYNYLDNLLPEDKRRYNTKLGLLGLEKCPYKLPADRWMNDPKEWPKIEYNDVYHYLITSPRLYSTEAMENYRSSDAHVFFISGWVQTIFHIKLDNGDVLLKADVRRSYSVNEAPHHPWLALKKSGQVITAHCDCTAGVCDGTRKKSRKKKLRRPKGVEKSSGDSDSQTLSEDTEGPWTHRHYEGHHHDGHHHDGHLKKARQHDLNQMSGSGAEADTEGQGTESVAAAGGDKTPLSPATEIVPEKSPVGQLLETDHRAMNMVPQLQKIQKAVELLSMSRGAAPKSMDEAAKKRYQFWETQPVPRLNEKITENEAIEADKPTDDIRQEPYSLPAGFKWDTLDIRDPLILKELYSLLNGNYVEDDDNMFRFDYSPEFLQWALQPPGWLPDWHCGVRATKSNKLVGFISAVPAHIKIYDKLKHMVEINFLCVHKKLRSKRVAPVLIREITRRVHLQGLFQAVYTAGVVLPKPVASCRYWHRSLNPRKLIEVKFSHLSRNMTMQRTLKLYKLPDSPKTPGFRPFTPADVTEAFNILNKYLSSLDLAPVFSIEEFKHWFIPRKGIVDSYVVESHGKITDFVSFYTLPSTVMHHPAHKSLKAAYSFYNVSTTTPWEVLIQDALIVAKNMGFDVFNALDLMNNKDFLEKLKFGIGDGNLQYYLYNWKCPYMEPHQVGLVLQ